MLCILSVCVTIDTNKLLENQNAELSKIQQILKKSNNLWKASNYPKSAEIIQNVSGHTLSKPEQTRWNNLYDALKQILTIKKKLIALHRSLNIRNSIRDVEFNYI